MENLCKVIDSSGVVQRIHGNTKRPRHNQIKLAEVIRVRDFITNVGNTHGSPLPGRLPNATEKTLLLPSDMPKNKVYKDYKAVCEQIMVTPVGRSKFYELWRITASFNTFFTEFSWDVTRQSPYHSCLLATPNSPPTDILVSLRSSTEGLELTLCLA